MKMNPSTFLRLAAVCALSCLQYAIYANPTSFSKDTLPNPFPNFEGIGWYIATPNVIIQNTTVREKEVAMWVNYPTTGNEPQPEIVNNIFQINDFGIYIQSGNPYVRYNSLGNNQAYGAYNEPTNVEVNVCENWWGHQSGPQNSALNPTGLGSRASDNLVFVGCYLTNVPNRQRLDLRLFLQGAYVGNGMMSTQLTDFQLTPLGNPYHTTPWNHKEDVAAIPMPSDVTDWVLISLRHGEGAGTTIQSKAVLLRENGTVFSPDGRPLYFNLAPGLDSLFVVAYHRNHVGMMSQGAIPVVNNTLSFDFSTAATFGGLLGKADLGDGRFALLSGDYDANGQVQNTDFNNLLPELGISGYRSGDFNLNSQVQNTDIQNFLTPNIGRGAAFEYSY